MQRNIPFVLTALIAIGVLSSLATHSTDAQDSIPKTPAGKCLAALIDAINTDDGDARTEFLKSRFVDETDEAMKKRQDQTDRVRSQFGKFTFNKMVASAEHEISANFATASGPNILLSIEVTDDDLAKISSIHLEVGADDDDTAELPDFGQSAREESIERLASELRSKYVFPKMGETMASAIEKSLAAGDYEEAGSAQTFATLLTKQLRDLCHDKHLRVRPGSPRAPSRSPGQRASDNHGFVKVEMLPGGVGYLKFNYFSGQSAAEDTAAAAMNFLANSNAIIFDLRENGGGNPKMIAFLTSYLFDERVHLNSFYNRPTDTTSESWTQAEVPGRKLGPDTPVYVLTSNHTFSGAEEFSYNLKNLKRGIIVGETTGGGAHPVMPVQLGAHLHITMPFARAINPITKTNWEGVGVKPDVAVSADAALEKALELARRTQSATAKSAKSDESDNSSNMKQTETTNIDIAALAQKARQLMSDQSFPEAIEAFEKLTKLTPENGDVWFRYGYCLHADGQLDKAIEVHQHAAQFESFAGIATYNLACAYSLKKKIDPAIEALEKAVELGFGDVNQLKNDSDFDNIREEAGYQAIVKKLDGDNS